MNPFTRIDSPMLLGRPLQGFACIQCGEAPTNFLVAAMAVEDHGKPSIVLSYALCGRCGGLFYEEAGERFARTMRVTFSQTESDI